MVAETVMQKTLLDFSCLMTFFIFKGLEKYSSGTSQYSKFMLSLPTATTCSLLKTNTVENLTDCEVRFVVPHTKGRNEKNIVVSHKTNDFFFTSHLFVMKRNYCLGHFVETSLLPIVSRMMPFKFFCYCSMIMD